MRTANLAGLAAMVLLLSACGEQPAVPAGAGEPPDQGGEAAVEPGGTSPDPDAGSGPGPDGTPPGDGLEVVPVLAVHAAIEDGGPRLRDLVWNAIAAEDLAQFQAAGDAREGQGTATLTDAEGRSLAESPAEVMHDSGGGVSVSAYLLVPEDAQRAERLHIELDDGGELTVERDGDVDLELDLPAPGPLADDATVSWRASAGTVEGRWLVGAVDLAGASEPAVHGASGTTGVGGASLPADGGWLLLVASHGLAFDLEVAGPYLHPDGGATPVEWRVLFVDGDIEDLDVLEIPAHEPAWHENPTVWVLPPGGGDVHPDDIEGTWTSDRQGDLDEVNMASAPELWLEPADLLPGDHVWTLHLDAELPDGSTASHEVRIDVRVGDG